VQIVGKHLEDTPIVVQLEATVPPHPLDLRAATVQAELLGSPHKPSLSDRQLAAFQESAQCMAVSPTSLTSQQELLQEGLVTHPASFLAILLLCSVELADLRLPLPISIPEMFDICNFPAKRLLLGLLLWLAPDLQAEVAGNSCEGRKSSLGRDRKGREEFYLRYIPLSSIFFTEITLSSMGRLGLSVLGGSPASWAPAAVDQKTESVGIEMLSELDDHEAGSSTDAAPADLLLALPLQLLVAAGAAFGLLEGVAEAMGAQLAGSATAQGVAHFVVVRETDRAGSGQGQLAAPLGFAPLHEAREFLEGMDVLELLHPAGFDVLAHLEVVQRV
jgi:hypothetical protein